MAKNKSTRSKKLDQARARRRARAVSVNQLMENPPDFDGYREWFQVPAEVAMEGPARWAADPQIAGDPAEFLTTLVRLRRHYGGQVPLAAVLIENQIKAGIVAIASNVRPGEFSLVKLEEMAERIAAKGEVELAETPVAAEDAGDSIHALLAVGALVLDDDGVLHMAVPPWVSGDGKWLLSGTTDWS